MNICKENSPLRYLESLIRNHELNLARAVANELISSDPKNSKYYRKLIQIEELDQRPHIALMIYPELVKLSEDKQDILNWYRRMYQVRDYDLLLKHYKSIADQIHVNDIDSSIDVQIWLYFLRACLHCKAFDEFEANSEQLKRFRKKAVFFYQVQAAYHLLRHQAELAIPLLKEGCDVFPDSLSLHLLSALAFYAEGQFEEAENFFWSALENGSALAFAYLLELCPQKKELYQLLNIIPAT